MPQNPARPPGTEPAPPARVLLVHMPFGALKWPALGISLLKAAAVRKGIACDVRYLNLAFAARIGVPLYHWLANDSPAVSLFGERLFSHQLFATVADPFDDFDAVDLDPGRRRALLDAICRVRDDVGGFLDHCLATVPWAQYDVIGFSSTFQQNVPSLALAKRIKAAWPDKIIVFGGANCEGDMGLELHRQFPFVDFVCRGESDELFPRLLESLLGGTPPPDDAALVGRSDGESVTRAGGSVPVTDLDGLPYPDFDDYFAALAVNALDFTGQVELLFESSRGCWYGAKQHCTFCGLNGETMGFRSKSAGRVIEEIVHLTERYGVTRLLATDNILDMRHLRDVMPALAERRPGLSLFYEVKANLRRDQLRLLKRAGVTALQPGIESLSTSILALMRKGCTALQNVQLLKWASEAGIALTWNIIRGFPGETPDEYVRMAAMIPSLMHLEPPRGVYGLRLDRFSPHFTHAQSFGLTNLRPAAGYRRAYALDDASLERLAYHFDYDHADGRDTAGYVAPLRAMVQQWQAGYCLGGLTMQSSDASLAIADRRPGAARARTVLDGAERAIYEFCDEAHRLEAIARHLIERGYPIEEATLRRLLEQWVEERLMLRDGDWFLSLAVRTDDWWKAAGDSDWLREALTGALMDLTAIRRQTAST
nr:hypothetical protein Hi04_10k_c4711_00029 [uncultured bacterium]